MARLEVGRKLSPKQAMREAIRLARKGMGAVSPNPAVGCVIVDSEHRFVSSGYHEKFGGPHAEVNALKGIDPKGCHVYVTLEPCAHEGKTPACAKTLAELPIASVTIGRKDPNPVASRGADILREAGIEVHEFSGFETELKRLTEIFEANVVEKRTFVSLKVAASLDGQIAMKNGESRWITSAGTREHVHLLRSYHEGILVGLNTFLQDDPALNVRHGRNKGKELKVFVLDAYGRSLESLKYSKLWDSHKPENIHIVTLEGVSGPNTLEVPFTDGSLDLKVFLKKLYDMKVYSLFVEGGSGTYSSFLKEKIVDRVYQYSAPVIIGSKNAIAWSKDFGSKSLAEKLVLSDVQYKKLPPDLLVTGRPQFD